MKRKLIISLVVLIVGVISTIAARADLYSGRTSTSQKRQTAPSGRPVFADLLSTYISTREEGSYLVLEGGVFLVLGLWLKSARRKKLLVESGSISERD